MDNEKVNENTSLWASNYLHGIKTNIKTTKILQLVYTLYGVVLLLSRRTQECLNEFSDLPRQITIWEIESHSLVLRWRKNTSYVVVRHEAISTTLARLTYVNARRPALTCDCLKTDVILLAADIY